jgi:glycine/serine hydroxymethyltransferase
MFREISELKKLIVAFDDYHKTSLPLCAAENVMSEFAKLPLFAGFQERYIMGSAYDYTINDNFIGSEFLLPFYEMISKLGSELFCAKYTDARTLTGMNAANLLASALLKPGDKIMILGKHWGGHASMAPTFERLLGGGCVIDAPYNLDNYDFDYDALNREIKEKNIKFLNIAPSDILFPHDFSKIDNSNCVIMFDYSQLLGLIAAGLLENPLDKMKNSILFGGTHKTIPGPAHGIIMTNNNDLYTKIDKEINPKYLRNVQMHQVISLLFAMVEMKYFGKPYQENTVRIGNLLGAELEKLGFTIVKRGNIYTQTHQLFIECSQKQMQTIFQNAAKEHITLNTKKKPLFHGGFGIRLGQQEISRYNWSDDAIKTVAKILSEIAKSEYDSSVVQKFIKTLPPKTVHFTFDKNEYAGLV